MATFLSRFHRDKSEKILPNDVVNAEIVSKKTADMETAALTATPAATAAASQARPQRRYMRSATAASVTQLLSESCNSLLQRFRRNPSERTDNKQQQQQQQRNRAAAIAEESNTNSSKSNYKDRNDIRRSGSATPTNDNSNQTNTKNKASLTRQTKRRRSSEKSSSSRRRPEAESLREPDKERDKDRERGRERELAPNTMSDRHRRYYAGGGLGYHPINTSSGSGSSSGPLMGRYQKSSTTANAMDRLRTHLSPIGGYYKSTMRGLGAGTRPNLDDRRELILDKDKTPTVSAVSRLENKYSDILERAAGRRRHEEDRDKTLEPDDYGATSSGLLRSATSHQLAKSKLSSSSFSAADRKERTPYRTRAQRQRYMADSTDSGYLTSGNRLLDENYPVDYSNSRYHDYHDALRAGGASGYPSSRYNRYGRGFEEDTALNSARLNRAYGRNKSDLRSTDLPDGGQPEERAPNTRSRFANRRREQTPPELTAEDREILADDRSSEDNAAIILLLREDNQFLEAKKFEERMRRRRELRERVKRMEELAAEAQKTEAAEAAAAVAAVAEAEAREQQAAKEAAAAAAAAAVKAATAAAAAATSTEEAPKKKSRNKKVTNDDDSDASDASNSSSTSESSSDEANSAPETAAGVRLTNTTADISQTTTTTNSITDKANTPPTNYSLNGTKTTSNNNNTTSSTTKTIPSALSNLSLHDTAATASSSSSSSNKSRFLHSDRNNNNNNNSNDLSKYKPSNILHSTSSGALAFGGIGARLAAADTRRQQQRYQGASSRTAAVLSDFDRYKPSSGVSYLHDTTYGSGSSSSRRSNALGGSSLYQRQQLDPYHQQQQQQQSSSSHYLQQHDHYLLSKSATSSALFHRSRIPKTLSTFVSHSMHILLYAA